MKELKMIMNADGVFEEYDDTYDLTIHCTSQEEQDEVLMKLNKLNGTVCVDAISRDMALEKMADYVASGYADSAEDFEEYSRIICQLPPIKPAEKVGRWKRVSMDKYVQHAMAYYRCSECGKDIIGTHNYCPNCGAKMQEVTG